MAGYAESIDANTVAFGAHSGDHAIYPDCRPEFAYAANTTIFLSSDRKIVVEAPFLYLDKTKILDLGYSLPLEIQPPYELTRTCYKDQELSCGKCGSCVERLESFRNIGRKDPIKYEE
jgi:7-cyano-7-deazaguanine synthase